MTRTPWGTADHSEEYVDGITFHGTPSHGGFKVKCKLNRQIPDYMRCGDGWYEEDCDWAIVATVFPIAFCRPGKTAEEVNKTLASAQDTLRNWHPEAFERFYGRELAAGESYVKDQRTFERDHAADLIVTSARGDWAADVPAGMVGVTATIGGKRDGRSVARHFLVPAAEYEGRGRFGFVIDGTRHVETKI